MKGIIDLDVYVLDPYTGRPWGYLVKIRSLAEGVSLLGLQPVAANPAYAVVRKNRVRIGRHEYLIHANERSATPGARRIRMTRMNVRDLFDRLLERGFVIGTRPTRKTDLLPMRVA